MAVKLDIRGTQADGIREIISKLEKEWKGLFPDQPFKYSFLDESIALLSRNEQQTEWLMNVAMCVTIFISCMGLFGLAMYTAEKRTGRLVSVKFWEPALPVSSS